MLATAVSGEDDLGPEVITKIQSLTLAPGGDHLSPLTAVASVTSSGTRAADGCWPGKATSTRSSTVWCWNSSLRGCPRRPRSRSSATCRRRWTWPSNSWRTRWRRATGLANLYLPSLSLSLLLLPFLPLFSP